MTDETCLLQWRVRTDKLVISGLEFDRRDVDPDAENLVWKATPMGEIVAPKGYEVVIRNENGVISLLRRKVSETEKPA